MTLLVKGQHGLASSTHEKHFFVFQSTCESEICNFRTAIISPCENNVLGLQISVQEKLLSIGQLCRGMQYIAKSGMCGARCEWVCLQGDAKTKKQFNAYVQHVQIIKRDSGWSQANFSPCM